MKWLMDRWMDEMINGWMDEWLMYGWINEVINGWIDGWMNG